MLATLAALQIIFAAHVSASPPPDDPLRARSADPALAAGEPGTIPTATPLPGRERASGEAVAPLAQQSAPAETGPGAATPAPGRQLSLLSAESLHGGSAALAWAGYPSFGAAYMIGFSPRDDGGFGIDYDWAKSEARIGVLYRRPLPPAAAFDVAFRLAANWYENFGATYFYDRNHSDRGLQFVPGLGASMHAAGGIFSGIAEAPMTVTWKYHSGFLFQPRVSAAFEAPLYPQVTVGVLAGLGYRAGAGDAPLKGGRGEVRFLVLWGYHVL